VSFRVFPWCHSGQTTITAQINLSEQLSSAIMSGGHLEYGKNTDHPY
jgi:hypothetical protein